MPDAGKVLVLGGSGFFGGWICRELEAAGAEILAPSRQERGDLLDPDGLRGLIADQAPATVINAAGMTSPVQAKADPAGCFEVNAGGVQNLLEALRLEAPEARLIALSSAAVLAGEAPFTEGSATGALTPYAASKLAMEIICDQYRRGYGLPVTVLRCFNLTGPGEPASQATSEFALAALSAGEGGRVVVEVGNPETSRDFTDVRDAARAIAATLASEFSGLLNLCSGRATSLSALAGTISRLTGATIELQGREDGRPASGLLTVSGNPGLLRDRIGFSPRIGLEQSLEDLIEWLRTRI